jgi:hypothetical protein
MNEQPWLQLAAIYPYIRFNFKEEYLMPCLLALFAAFLPRVADIFIWIARPQMFMNAFNNMVLWPILGIIFLPFTTLFYVVLYTPGVGLVGWDWLWIAMAVFCDLAHYGNTFYQNKNSIPGTTSTPSTPAA